MELLTEHSKAFSIRCLILRNEMMPATMTCENFSYPSVCASVRMTIRPLCWQLAGYRAWNDESGNRLAFDPFPGAFILFDATLVGSRMPE